MSNEFAASLFGGVIFCVFAYVCFARVKFGEWPKVRNPFYFDK